MADALFDFYTSDRYSRLVPSSATVSRSVYTALPYPASQSQQRSASVAEVKTEGLVKGLIRRASSSLKRRVKISLKNFEKLQKKY